MSERAGRPQVTEYREVRTASINLWEPRRENGWLWRRDILQQELWRAGLVAGGGVFIALQEVFHNEYQPLEAFEELGFTARQIRFFPTRERGPYGLAVVTDLPIIRDGNFNLSHEPEVEQGQRNIGLVQVRAGDKKLTLGVTHLTWQDQAGLQRRQAQDAVRWLVNFMREEGSGQEHDQPPEQSRPLALVGADLNAARETPAYRTFLRAGLRELTASLREVIGWTWPVDVAWLDEMAVSAGKEPDGKTQLYQRWMDYIFSGGEGMKPIGVRVLGSTPTTIWDGVRYRQMYLSDHAAVAADVLVPVVVF